MSLLKRQATVVAKNDTAGARPQFVVPRAWLIALALLVIVPWLVAAFVHFQLPVAVIAPADASDAKVESSAQISSGRWGRLSITPIVISPPLEFVAPNWDQEVGTNRWFFPGVSADEVEKFLVNAGLPAEQAARLRAGARVDPSTGSLVLSPDPDLVRSLDPQVRSRLYLQLGHTRLNVQSNALRFFGSVDQWLDSRRMSERSRQLVKSLSYSDGAFQHFADVQVIQSEIKDPEERRRIGKVLTRNATFLVRLHVDNDAEVVRLAEYWGRGGRRMDLRPLLESVAGGAEDHAIDIVHLLPPIARNHLYRYPKISTADYDRPLLANCLWSALNFFALEPDDRFYDENRAVTSLKNDYYLVEGDLQLGDVVAFVDEEGILFHVAVYIAGDLVFTKNGTSRMAPWIIATIDQVKGYYHIRSSNPRLMFHRRNDF